ncbi:MFS transporter [Spirochaetia bacterium 38H-sp]|uniref:MFS transporter n=1 Tax=Rarispira pelagica TaxID=3141764 RepID=A0ABU9U9N5_9SPIR
MEEKKLSRKLKLGYGVGDLGGNLFFTMMGFYLLYYLTDIVKLPAALAGTVLFVGKAWDAISDPIVGTLSDRTVSRMGRRRPYMFYGALFLLVFMTIVFFPVTNASVLFKVVWYAVMLCFLNTAYTMVNIPYSALAPELTADYNERTVLNAYRNIFALLGTFSGALLIMPLASVFPDVRLGWPFMGAVVGLIILITTFITVFTVREKPRTNTSSSKVQVLQAYLSAMSLKSFRIALATWSLFIIGINVIQAALVYYFTYVTGGRGSFSVTLMVLLSAALVSVPFWAFVAMRKGKRFAWNLGMLIFAVSVVLFVFLGPRVPLLVSYLFILVGGFGFSTQYAIPYAVLPDIVEYDFVKNGIRREGVFYGIWTFMSKAGQALASFMTGLILQFFGYVPPLADGAPAAQPDSALLGIRLLVGPIPAVFFIVGVIVFLFYPITREFYDRVIRMAEERGSST